MLIYEDKITYVFYAKSFHNDRLIAQMQLTAPNKDNADYIISMKFDDYTPFTIDEKTTLSEDIIEFTEKVWEKLQADS